MPALTAHGALPSAAVKAGYQKALVSLIGEMHASVCKEVQTKYREHEDAITMAMDDSPWDDLKSVMAGLFGRWRQKFDDFAASAAKNFGRRVNATTTSQLKATMKKAGLTVKFGNSRRVEEQISAIVRENVNLIKSIPKQYLDEVHEIVLESVERGRDMGYITKSLEERFGVSRNRAILIARDQTNKATEAISRARCKDIGITHGIWMHRSGAKAPRATHKDFDGERFELDKGFYDPQAEKVKGVYRGKWVKPAELVNCHCTFRLDISTVGAGMAADAAFGIRRVAYPAATVEWRAAA